MVNQCFHHALLAHGYAVRAVREHGGPGARVGLVHDPFTAIPVTEKDADIAAARALYAQQTAQILGPLCTGVYPDAWWRRVGADAPRWPPATWR